MNLAAPVQLRAWPARQFALALAAAAGMALVIGVPTDIVPNPWFSRTVAAEWWDVVILAITSVLGGLVVATFATPTACPSRRRETRAGFASGVLTIFSVACPVCHQVVIAVLGAAGALVWFAPVQPLLGIAGIVLMAWVLRARLRAAR
jgi:hypothetical protein